MSNRAHRHPPSRLKVDDGLIIARAYLLVEVPARPDNAHAYAPSLVLPGKSVHVWQVDGEERFKGRTKVAEAVDWANPIPTRALITLDYYETDTPHTPAHRLGYRLHGEWHMMGDDEA